jgi:hypothetical protein
MRLPLFTRVFAAILSLVTGLAAPSTALSHGLEHARAEHEEHHASHARLTPHEETRNLATPVVEVAAGAEHPHYDLVSATCCKIALRLPALVQPNRFWAAPQGFVTSQRAVPTDQSSWIDPPLTRTVQPRAPPRR